jgi:exonuclease SbcC
LIEQKTIIGKEGKNLTANIQTYSEEIKTRIKEVNQACSLQINSEDNLNQIQESISNYLLSNESEQHKLSSQLIYVKTRLELNKFASSLSDESPCPLCGSKDHPMVLHEDNTLSYEVEIIENSKLQLQKLESAVRQFQGKVERIFDQILNLENQKAEILIRWKDIQARIKDHEETFVWTQFDKNNREAFNRYFNEVAKAQAEIKDNETAIKKISQLLETETKEKAEKIEQPLQNLRNEILKIENTISTLTDQLEKVNPDDFEGQDRASVPEKIEALKKQYKDLNQLYEQTEKQIDILEKEKNTISGSQHILEETLQRNRNELILSLKISWYCISLNPKNGLKKFF